VGGGIGASWADRRVTRPSLVVLLLGLVITGVLSWVCYAVNDRDETRLLALQSKQAGTVLQVVLPTIQTPLASAAEIASTTAGDATRFHTYMSAYVGAQGPFVSATLWRLDSAPHLVATIGAQAALAGEPGKAETFLSGLVRTQGRSPTLSVLGLLVGAQPRLGYAFTSAGESPSYAVYAEAALPATRRATVQPGSAFADLNFALYLGRSADPNMLLESSTARVPIIGRTATVVVPFGSTALTLVASPAGRLGSALSAWLWWIVGAGGTALAVIAALVAEILLQRRVAAEQLTDEVRLLLGQQRGIAESLQRALLPHQMPTIPGMEIGTRYHPGVNGVEIGGDWYDVIALDEHRFFFVIGDVSGRGVSAGSVMASLQFAVRGFVSENHPPAHILDLLAGLLDLRRDGHFATVLCGIADAARHEITLANAGHLPALLLCDGQAEFLSTSLGPPIGVSSSVCYQSVNVTVPPQATLLLYTDGLVERREEDLDNGLTRLRDSAISAPASVADMLNTVEAALILDGHDDDTAILAIRWLN
jgi:serine phosphatase RsbU (regulator of sigma subunit)